MIKADFYTNSQNILTGFVVTGHAGFADFGSDVCCASVSSAVMMTANTITDVFKINAEVVAEENEFSFKLQEASSDADKVLLGLVIHLENLREEFGGLIKVQVHESPEKLH